MERTAFAIDNAKDEDEDDGLGDDDAAFGIGGDDDDQVMDEVDAFLEAHDSGLSAADQELAKGTHILFIVVHPLILGLLDLVNAPAMK